MLTKSLSAEKMTTTDNATNVGLLLSILCLGIVFVGGWYFQSSVVELRTLVADQQEAIMEQRKELLDQKIKIIKQEETIQQLKQM